MKYLKSNIKKLLIYSGILNSDRVQDGYHFKGHFSSTHSESLNIIKEKSKVLDFGCYDSSVAEMLVHKKECIVDGVDENEVGNKNILNNFIKHNLNEGPPKNNINYSNYDYIIMLDVIEHLDNPEKFIKELKYLIKENKKITLIFSTPNIAFFIIRLSLLFGNFNYAPKGILDFTHKRLFTFSSFSNLFKKENFKIIISKGIPAPFPSVFGETRLSYMFLKINSLLIKLNKKIFGFQIFFIVKNNLD